MQCKRHAADHFQRIFAVTWPVGRDGCFFETRTKQPLPYQAAD
jgi:hypothetical protein